MGQHHYELEKRIVIDGLQVVLYNKEWVALLVSKPVKLDVVIKELNKLEDRQIGTINFSYFPVEVFDAYLKQLGGIPEEDVEYLTCYNTMQWGIYFPKWEGQDYIEQCESTILLLMELQKKTFAQVQDDLWQIFENQKRTSKE